MAEEGAGTEGENGSQTPALERDVGATNRIHAAMETVEHPMPNSELQVAP
jgi:hypothetical protein